MRPTRRLNGYFRSHPGQAAGILGLAGGGVCHAKTVTGFAVRSCRTISPLPVSRQVGLIGCVFSVALSRGSPRVAVSHRRALSCSDFPPRTYFENRPLGNAKSTFCKSSFNH